MKAERPTRHKPVTEEDAGSSNEAGGDDITEGLSKLTICSSNKSKPLPNNIVECKKKGDQEENKLKREKGEKQKEESVVKAKPKDGEKLAKEEEQKKPEGDLLSRGPVPVVNKWKTQAITSQSPYPRTVQINRTHGGCILYENHSPSSNAGLRLEDSLLYQNYNIQNDYNNVTIPDIGLTADNSDLPDITLPTIVNENSPVGAFIPDEDLKKIIEEVTSDPELKKNFVEDILKDPLIDGTRNITQHMQEPCQVVPQRHHSSSSAYSNYSSSPPGPSSPNFYATTPNFSPNVPSPQINLYDDCSNTIYSPPYCTNYQSPLQRPLSSCSSSSTNCSSAEADNFDINEIINLPNIEERKVEEIKQELATSCSENYIPNCLPQSNCLGSVATNSSVIMVVVPNQIQFPKKKADGVNTGSSRTPRPILPKLLPPGSERTVNIQDIMGRQQVMQNRMPPRQNAYPLLMKEQLIQRIDPAKLKRAWTQAMIPTNEDIAGVDSEGDTKLMILVCSPGILQKLEQVYTVVERYKTIPGALAQRNIQKQSALYMACILLYEEPLVANYIAEALVDINCDLDIQDEEDGTTLIHHLCKEDKYSTLLNELLSLKNKRGKCCFDINKGNYEGRSPLHVAVEMHNSGVSCLKIVNVLLQHGADVLRRDGKQGLTALHLALSTSAPDKYLIQILCNFADDIPAQFVQERESNVTTDLVNAKNFKGDTPLHIAMAYGGGMEFQTLVSILKILPKAGAVRAIRNNNGKVPLELAPEAHKAEIKRILDKYSAK